MGTEHFLNAPDWDRRAKEIGSSSAAEVPHSPIHARAAFQHSGDYQVSAIASLYRGRKYLERFLDNVVSQTIFDRAELIIIDADSPEGEHEIIAEYQKIYPNIVYKRMNYRIGIYDAWNVGVEMSRGEFLTN